MRLEDRGRSLSLHYRGALGPAVASALLPSLARSLLPHSTVIDGTMVLSLLPAGVAGRPAVTASENASQIKRWRLVG